MEIQEILKNLNARGCCENSLDCNWYFNMIIQADIKDPLEIV